MFLALEAQLAELKLRKILTEKRNFRSIDEWIKVYTPTISTEK